MNITDQTINALKEMGYGIHFQDEQINVCSPIKACEIYIGYLKLFEGDMQYIGKTIKATKKETTLEYILNKISSEKTFRNFSNQFNKVIKSFGLSAYPTTYGIGIFVAIGFRSEISECKNKIENALSAIGVEFKTEYSEAGWVFRYKISQSAKNIKTIENYINQNN
jgi:hypothetical protein